MPVKVCPKCRNEYSQGSVDNWLRTGAWICSFCKKNELDNQRAEAENYKHKKLITAKPCSICGRKSSLPHPHIKSVNTINSEEKKKASKSWWTDIDTKVSKPPPKKKRQRLGLQYLIDESILFDINKIPKEVRGEQIIKKIIEGHNEKQLGIVHFETSQTPDPPVIQLEKLTDVLDDKLLQGLKKYGFSGILEFQEECTRAILDDKNTIMSAPTGSGKTEAFAIPIIQKIIKQKYPSGVFALLVYPLNALIDDQISKIKNLVEKCGLDDKIFVSSIHGGQSQDYKEKIRIEAQNKCVILATNFDFINWHLIVQTKNWKELFRPAKVIVMDEAHSYSSFHGSNVYHVIKRMKNYMKNVQFIGSSATLDNAEEFFSDMFDLPIDSIKYIKSRHGRKQYMHKFFIIPRAYRQRMAMEKLASICFRYGEETGAEKGTTKQLIFSNTHNDAEFLATNVEDANKNIRIQVHRGGLSQKDKTVYESAMKNGDLDALSCTPTLELGIDIGHVDVAISAFKNEYDSFVQRIGRAGRNGQRSYAFCVFDPDDASCHYYSRDIKEYVSQKHKVQINKENPIISEKHSAAEKIEKEAAHAWDKKQFWDFANGIKLRGTSGEVKIFLNNRLIGTRDVPTGYYQLHQKAIYHFNKRVYQVDSITRTKTGASAYLSESSEKNKRTQPIVIQRLTNHSTENDAGGNPMQKTTDSELRSISVKYGLIELDRTVVGYYKGDFNKPIQEFDLFKGEDDPSWRNFNWQSKHMSVAIELPDEFLKNVSTADVIGGDPGIHTVTHVFANAAKIVSKAESNDIDAYYDGRNLIYLYDNTSDGANGCSKIIYEQFDKVLEICRNLLIDCDCHKDGDEDWGGCPRCTFTTSFCPTKNNDLSKQIAKGFFGVL